MEGHSKDAGNAMSLSKVSGGQFQGGGRRKGGGKKGMGGIMSGGMDEDMFSGGGMMGAMGGAGDSGKATKKGLKDSVYDGVKMVSEDSSKLACECNHAIMVEAMKKIMFNNKNQ